MRLFFPCYVFVGLFLATSSAQNSPTDRASLSSADIEALSSLLSQDNKTSPLQVEGCLTPASGSRVVKTQDALIALSQLAMGGDFDQRKTSDTSGLLAHRNTAAIRLLKHGQGHDIFSKHDLALTAIAIFWHCIIQDPNGLGGVLEVGSKNIFRLTFQSPVIPQTATSEGRKDE
ncbi:MAG: hypothetical protein Q9216_001336 [Gyalolechia sp. 2 TL-2023]